MKLIISILCTLSFSTLFATENLEGDFIIAAGKSSKNDTQSTATFEIPLDVNLDSNFPINWNLVLGVYSSKNKEDSSKLEIGEIVRKGEMNYLVFGLGGKRYLIPKSKIEGMFALTMQAPLTGHTTKNWNNSNKIYSPASGVNLSLGVNKVFDTGSSFITPEVGIRVVKNLSSGTTTLMISVGTKLKE
jgi:hypothetical protein